MVPRREKAHGAPSSFKEIKTNTISLAIKMDLKTPRLVSSKGKRHVSHDSEVVFIFTTTLNPSTDIMCEVGEGFCQSEKNYHHFSSHSVCLRSANLKDKALSFYKQGAQIPFKASFD